MHSQKHIGPVAQLDRASDYGSEGWEFDSSQVHNSQAPNFMGLFFIMYYLYILKSNKDGRLYKGITKNLEERIDQHNRGKTKSTKPFRPWKLVYFEKYPSRIKAREREIFFKSGEGRELLKQIIDKNTNDNS